uniref:MHC class Ia antigen n=1 Tax=Dicentrarchus labrax TaxID=13489 RepID=G9BBU8_DICLA|nr:MHC class Ia antigen [Dicentrarchus labrax]
MKTLMFVVLLGIGLHGAAAVTHSLKYFYTASSGVPNFPEFVIVGLVDEVQMYHYDSNTRRAEPKQDWMSRVTEGKADYWEYETGNGLGTQQIFKGNIETAKQRFNQTGGVHVYQRMYGCEWDDETGEVNGYDQWGYDGEDFIVFDLKTETFIAPRPQAVITKHKWDNDRAFLAGQKQYYTQICPEWLKKYVNYGRSSLLRTELPSVSLLQKTSSSPVRCHATGFYPDSATLIWRKDGEEIHEDVDHGEILLNHDGSFQMSVDLKLHSSVTPEDWRRYNCVFQLSGVKNDIVIKLDKSEIKTNWGKTGIRSEEEKPDNTTVIIIAAVVVLALAVIVVIGVVIYKKKNEKRPPSPISNPEVMEQLNPNA